jgi:Tfp pilus assembly protein PilW
MKHAEGFTIVEVLITMTVGLVVVGAIYAAVIATQNSSVSLEKKVSANQDVRAAIAIMESEIRMASFNPNFVSGMWRGTGCDTSLYQERKGIQQATATAITVEMDLDESSVIGDANNEIITYTYDPTNQYITRTANCGTADPFLGDVTGATKNVRVVNDPSTDPVFRYYDGTGTLISDPANHIPSIRRVEITLIVDTEEIAADTKQRRRTIYTTSVIPRNHAISP